MVERRFRGWPKFNVGDIVIPTISFATFTKGEEYEVLENRYKDSHIAPEGYGVLLKNKFGDRVWMFTQNFTLAVDVPEIERKTGIYEHTKVR